MKTGIGLRLLLFAAVLVSLSSDPSRCQAKPDIRANQMSSNRWVYIYAEPLEDATPEESC